MRSPDYRGGGLVNLVAELEYRLTGSAASPRLDPAISRLIPPAPSYVFVLIDGLGDGQLGHPEAAQLARARVASLDASFSTQTTVNTATLATGLPPSQHGLIAYLLRLPEQNRIANTIFWFGTDGAPLDLDFSSFLPAPNLAERMTRAGTESIVIEPAAFAESPLEQVLYRGSTVVGSGSDEEAVGLALEAVARPGRLVAVYVPQVDAAGHTAGQASDLYGRALREATQIWQAIAAGLPPGAVALATADHGQIDVSPGNSIRLPDIDGTVFFGDSRVVFVCGDEQRASSLACELPARWVSPAEMEGWWGPPPYHPEFPARRPNGALVADPGVAFRYPGNEVTMVGYHGGLTEPELRIPLLVSQPGS